MARAPNRKFSELRTSLARSTHYMAVATTKTRCCYYCGGPSPTAFYLQDQKAWACVPCYIQTYVPTPALTSATSEEALAAAS